MNKLKYKMNEMSDSCIIKHVGTKYAMISMKVILANLIRTFIFKVNKSIEINEIKLQTNVLLSTTKPLKVRIEKRENLNF